LAFWQYTLDDDWLQGVYSCDRLRPKEDFILSTYLKQLLLAVGLIVMIGGTAVPAKAIIALEVFNFTGTCAVESCSFSNATLELIGGSFTPGSPLTTDDLYDFSYTSNLLSFNINGDDTDVALSGVIPTTLPGPANISVSDSGFSFNSTSEGSWSAFEASDDAGANSVWSANVNGGSVPEPGTMAMLGMGLAGAIMVRYRRGRGYWFASRSGYRARRDRS
jgi:hypothetical protein